ncbi:MAG: aldehyde dehydrogenase [Actinobacteria bacterium]|nr:aldehyde dehydrogenase [Actinomycetota bacterium]|tara:strand:- start:7787 stop:8614 length:828 start_codon:yes stop_codon:yes gene_type:complete
MNEVRKTYKMFVGNKFIRSESGRTYSIKQNKEVIELPQASKKDIRDAVSSAKQGYSSWSGLTAYNRAQVLYRLSEMIEGRKSSYVELLKESGVKSDTAKKDVEKAIEALIWYSGLADKWEQLIGNLNPVSGSYLNISHQEPLGVTFVFPRDSLSLHGLVLSVLPPLTVGCSVIMLNNGAGLLSVMLSEDVHNSDMPPGAWNILTGEYDAIIEDISKHVEIRGIAVASDFNNDDYKKIQESGSESVKRTYRVNESMDIMSLIPFLETKTVWHPKGK